MKRSGSLKRGKPLARGLPMDRGKGPRPRSKRTAKVYREQRIPLYDIVRAEQGRRCAWPGCTRDWVDLHEILTRARAGSITDRDNVIGLCRDHNREATDTRPAECLGVVVPSWAATPFDGDLGAALTAAADLRAAHETGDAPGCPWRRVTEGCTSPCPTQRSSCTP